MKKRLAALPAARTCQSVRLCAHTIPASAYVKLSLGLRRASHHDDEMVRE